MLRSSGLSSQLRLVLKSLQQNQGYLSLIFISFDSRTICRFRHFQHHPQSMSAKFSSQRRSLTIGGSDVGEGPGSQMGLRWVSALFWTRAQTNLETNPDPKPTAPTIMGGTFQTSLFVSLHLFALSPRTSTPRPKGAGSRSGQRRTAVQGAGSRPLVPRTAVHLSCK